MTTTPLNEQLDEVVKLNHSDPSQVLAEALRAGMNQIYVEAVLAAYLRGVLSREESAHRVGIDSVTRVDQERQAVREDVEWGLRG
jgi:hypothetical protein